MNKNNMKLTYLPPKITSIWNFAHEIEWSRHKRSLYLFSLLCLNAIAAPAVQAATGDSLAKTQAYAIALLGLITLALSVYLFVVIFQPERF